MPTATWPFVYIDNRRIAYIEGTKTRVIELAMERIAHHWDADELHRQHPHLPLAVIHSALAYYYEQKEECDQLIDEGRHTAEEIRRQTEDPELQTRLRKLSRR